MCLSSSSQRKALVEVIATLLQFNTAQRRQVGARPPPRPSPSAKQIASPGQHSDERGSQFAALLASTSAGVGLPPFGSATGLSDNGAGSDGASLHPYAATAHTHSGAVTSASGTSIDAGQRMVPSTVDAADTPPAAASATPPFKYWPHLQQPGAIVGDTVAASHYTSAPQLESGNGTAAAPPHPGSITPRRGLPPAHRPGNAELGGDSQLVTIFSPGTTADHTGTVPSWRSSAYDVRARHASDRDDGSCLPPPCADVPTAQQHHQQRLRAERAEAAMARAATARQVAREDAPPHPPPGRPVRITGVENLDPII